MSEKRVTFQYSFGEFCVFFQWVLFCANQLKGREKSSSAFSLQLEQSMPLCSVGGRRQIDGLRNRKWGVRILISCLLESPPSHQLQNILSPNWTYLPSRNRVADVENKLVVMKKGRWGEIHGDWDWLVHTTKYNNKDLQHRELYSVVCNDLPGNAF